MSTIFAFYVAFSNNRAIINYMGIYDIVFIVIAVLALFIGIKKGIAGVLLGFLGSLIIGVALGFGVNALMPSLIYDENSESGYSSSFDSIYQKVNDGLSASGSDFLSCELVKGEDDSLYVKGVFVEGGEEELKKFSEVLISSFSSSDSESGESGESSVSSIDAIDNMINTYGADGMTVANAVSAFMSQIILGAIIWLIAFIVLIIVKAIIRHCIYKFLDSHSAVSKIDRAIGAIISVVVIVMIAWVAVSLVGQNAESWGIGEMYNSVMEDNQVLGFFSSHNLFGGNTPDPDPETSEMTVRMIERYIR